MIDTFMLDDIKPKKDSLVDRDLESEIFKRLSKEVFSSELEKNAIFRRGFLRYENCSWLS